MKTLLILRHAKSDRDTPPALPDHERPLNSRGLKTAPLMGQLIKKNKLVPNAILSSSARRAIDTAKLVAECAGYDKRIQTVANFYPGTPASYIETLKKQTKDEESIMITGHNPGLESFVHLLTGYKDHLPTCSLTHIHLPIDHWSELTQKTKASLVNIYKPKEIFKELAEEK